MLSRSHQGVLRLALRILFALWLYATLDGVISGRELTGETMPTDL